MNGRPAGSHAVTPAARARATSDVRDVRAGKYPTDHPLHSFSTLNICPIGSGKIPEDCWNRFTAFDLVLCPTTFTKIIRWNFKALGYFSEFRLDAEQVHFRSFFELFNPNMRPEIPDKALAGFQNNHRVLPKYNIRPRRARQQNLPVTTNKMSYR